MKFRFYMTFGWCVRVARVSGAGYGVFTVGGPGGGVKFKFRENM